MKKIFTIALLVVLGSAGARAAAARKPGRSARLRAFADALLKTGKNDELDETYARLYRTAPCNTKKRSYAGKKTADGLDHEADATLEKSGRTGKPRAHELLLAVYEKSGRDGIGYCFRLSLDGKLERAFMMRGKMLDPRTPVMDAQLLDPRFTDLDVRAPEVKARLEHELDFWLKGPYRKGAASRPSGS